MSKRYRFKRPVFGNRDSEEFAGDSGSLERCFQEMGQLLQHQEAARQSLESRIRDLERNLRDQNYREQVAQTTRVPPEYPLNQLLQETAQQKQQMQELLRKIAEAQMRESTTKEDLEKQAKEQSAQRDAWLNEKLILEEKITALSRDAQEINSLMNELNQWKTRCEESSKLASESKRNEELLIASETQLKKALQDLKEEMGRLQIERSQQDESWRKKESEWLKAKMEWERQENAPVPNPPERSGAAMLPQAQNALSSIGRSMNEITSLLGSLRSNEKMPPPPSSSVPSTTVSRKAA